MVTGSIDQNIILSARNLPTIQTSYVTIEAAGEAKEIKSTINVYDIMKYDTLVLTKDAVANIEEVYA